LDVDDELGLLESGLQLSLFAFKLGDTVLLLRGRLRLATAGLLDEGLKAARLELATPVGQVGRVEPLTTQEPSDGARLFAGVGLTEDAALEIGGEATTGRTGFRVGLGARLNSAGSRR
jgi:hypothetical protein